MILVALDETAAAPRALRYAAELAGPLRATLVILRVLRAETYAMSAYPTAIDDGGRIASELEWVDALLKRVELQIGPLPDYEVAIDFALARHRRIAEMAEQHAADLIVMGAARWGIKQALFGTLAEKTRRAARCPVLTVNAP